MDFVYRAARYAFVAAQCIQSAAKMQPNGVIPGKLGTLGAFLAARVQPFVTKNFSAAFFGCTWAGR